MLLKMDQLRKGKHDRAEQGFNTETGVANQKLFFFGIHRTNFLSHVKRNACATAINTTLKKSPKLLVN